MYIMARKVVIHVSGGIAEVVKSPKETNVEILDFDRYQEEDNMGDKNDRIECPACHINSSTFEWNAATMHDFNWREGDLITKLQDCKPEEDDCGYACPYCFQVSSASALKGDGGHEQV
jgi:hypothetical protein